MQSARLADGRFLLLAVQPPPASNYAMNLLPIFALILAPNAPVQINDVQMKDIGCVAVIGIAAHEQRSKQGASSNYPNLGEDGKRWAGIVGDRVMAATGQPREVVAMAIQMAVKAEQDKAGAAADPSTVFQERLTKCVGAMNANLGAIDMAEGAEEAEQPQ